MDARQVALFKTHTGVESALSAQFVADAVSGTIQAFDLPEGGTAPEQDEGYNILDLDITIAEALGAEGRLIFGWSAPVRWSGLIVGAS